MFVILVVAGGIGALKYNVFDKNPAPQEAPKQMAIASDESTETMETASIVSPNGKKTLILEKQKNADDTTYTFYVEDSETGAKTSVLSKNLGPDQTMSAPDNAFSPDNRYFFVKENDAGALSYIVFNASGEPFSDGSNFIDVAPIFSSKVEEFKIAEVTGWDSETLLKVITTDARGTRGPSFWFEIPSGAAIRLASR